MTRQELNQIGLLLNCKQTKKPGPCKTKSSASGMGQKAMRLRKQAKLASAEAKKQGTIEAHELARTAHLAASKELKSLGTAFGRRIAQREHGSQANTHAWIISRLKWEAKNPGKTDAEPLEPAERAVRHLL